MRMKKFIAGSIIGTAILLAAAHYPEIEYTIQQRYQEAKYDLYFLKQERRMKKSIEEDYEKHRADYVHQEKMFEEELEREPNILIELSRTNKCISCDELRERLKGTGIRWKEFAINAPRSTRISEMLYLRGDLPVPIFATPVIIIYKDGKATGAYIGYSQREDTVAKLTRWYPIEEKDRSLENILKENPRLKK